MLPIKGTPLDASDCPFLKASSPASPLSRQTLQRAGELASYPEVDGQAWANAEGMMSQESAAGAGRRLSTQ
jgi:hypothetical protein